MENNLFTLNFKHLMTKTKVSLEGLAAEIGVGKSTVGNYRDGNSFPDVNVLIKIAGYFQVDVNDILFSNLLYNSNNSKKQENNNEKVILLEKFNKMENEQGNKSGNIAGNNGYILEENQGSDRVEEKQAQSHKIIKQPISQVINQGLSPPEAEILKERIQSLKEILKSKEEVLKAKDKHIELLEDKIKTLQNQVNNPLRVGENNIRDAA